MGEVDRFVRRRPEFDQVIRRGDDHVAVQAAHVRAEDQHVEERLLLDGYGLQG
jgi:hypothetical protein